MVVIALHHEQRFLEVVMKQLKKVAKVVTVLSVGFALILAAGIATQLLLIREATKPRSPRSKGW